MRYVKLIVIKFVESGDKSGKIDDLEKVYENITEEEKEYLVEAIGCAEGGFFRASIVLGWCSGVKNTQGCGEERIR